ncbi:SHOCT domain-containing protein [Streptomyces sp. NPDC001546]|uniref:SHOCT domain-containing protein n=1 Tax=Streptomyces sp. NPDC001546 TaxID=3364585 RepID=UPI003683D86C
MPGLLRGVARTAVVAGTATAVSNRVSRRQAGRWQAQQAEAQDPYAQAPAAQQQPPPPAPAPAPAPAPGMDDKIGQLKQLAELKEQGILTDEEFAAQKARILNG